MQFSGRVEDARSLDHEDVWHILSLATGRHRAQGASWTIMSSHRFLHRRLSDLSLRSVCLTRKKRHTGESPGFKTLWELLTGNPSIGSRSWPSLGAGSTSNTGLLVGQGDQSSGIQYSVCRSRENCAMTEA
jgi:hypothetical protein